MMLTLATVYPAHAAQDVEVSVGDGMGSLHGSLLMPDGAASVPAVLMIAGSGPTDRNGNSTIAGVRPNTLKLLAQGLAAQGIGSLRFDKRGIGASAGAMTAEGDLRFETYVDDAIAWETFLGAQKRVSCVTILGHSEGALIGALAAAKTKNICGFVSISGAGRSAPDVLAAQLSAQHGGLPQPLLGQALAVIATLKKGQTVADPPPQLSALFRPSAQPYLISWFAYDPVKAIGSVSAPILIVQGTTDLQVSVADAKLLAAGHPGAELALLDGVNHVLKSAPPDHAANISTYSEPDLPLAPGVVTVIADFVNRVSKQ
ncbi:MAG: alpha/beta hydrolase family protein [Terriglobales bacterium]